MTDYTMATGTTGTMMIRDTGSTVEFWFKAGYTNNWWNGLAFNFTINGSTYPVTINYPTGAPWVKIGHAPASYSQTVTFRLLTATGTTGMGGPTAFSKAISRSNVPAPPSAPVLSLIMPTTLTVTFTDGANGGLTITNRQIGWGTSSSQVQNYTTSDGSTNFVGLTPGTLYYFWARTYNANGWSGWSVRSSAQTLAGARINVNGVYKIAIPYQNVDGVWKLLEPWAKTNGVWKKTG